MGHPTGDPWTKNKRKIMRERSEIEESLKYRDNIFNIYIYDILFFI